MRSPPSPPPLYTPATQAIPRKNAKTWKMSADFQNNYRYNVCLCTSAVLADVLEHNCKSKRKTQVGFQRASVWAKLRENNVDADCWFPWRNVDAAAPKQMNLSPSSPKNQFSNKTSSKTESSVTMFLADKYPGPGPLASECSDQMMRFNLFPFLTGKKCSSICPEKNYRKFHSSGKRSRQLMLRTGK